MAEEDAPEDMREKTQAQLMQNYPLSSLCSQVEMLQDTSYYLDANIRILFN